MNYIYNTLPLKTKSMKRQIYPRHERAYPNVVNQMKKVVGLERHRYAPELNTLHYTDGTSVRTPQCQTIEEAVEYVNKRK